MKLVWSTHEAVDGITTQQQPNNNNISDRSKKDFDQF